MALRFETENPSELLERFEVAIENGDIRTWARDGGDDFTHTAKQWNRKAWMRPRIRARALVFNIVGVAESSMTKEVYAVFHGRLAESFVAHFDEDIVDCSLSPLLDTDDLVGP